MNLDADIDELLGGTFAKVGESPKVAEAAALLQAHSAAARPAPKPLVDPRTLAVRFSRLKAWALSGRHYLLTCQGEIHETIALRLGAGFHAEVFQNRHVVAFPGRRQGKAWERFEKQHRELGDVIVSDDEYATTMGMVRAVKEHPRALELLFDGTTTEQRIDWARGERECRSTPDAFHLAGDHQAELKSTRCSEPRWLAREALRRFYHGQMAFYDKPIEMVTGRRPGEDRIVAVENVPPFNVTVLRLTDEARELGAKIVHKWFERLLAAELHNHYGHYVEADVDLELPEYELSDHEHHAPVTVEVDGQLMTID